MLRQFKPQLFAPKRLLTRAQSTPSKERYDALIVGGGHNGLVAAAYLAKSGKSVAVLERRHVIGKINLFSNHLLIMISFTLKID